jgi:hypothetical protein
MTTDFNTGTYGAKRQSYSKASPRDLLKRLMGEHVGVAEHDLMKMFMELVRDDHDYLDAIVEYWFANNYRSTVRRPTAPISPKTSAAHAARVDKIKAAIKVKATRMVLLEMILPNGKTLAASTGRDCSKAGGWLAKIAKSIKPADVVGVVLSEAEVSKLFNAS